ASAAESSISPQSAPSCQVPRPTTETARPVLPRIRSSTSNDPIGGPYCADTRRWQLRFHRLKVLRRMPHPGRGFTQGLILDGHTVWESTGGYGQSALCCYPLGANRPDVYAPLPPELFGEGICQAGPYIWQLTWRERVALRWHPQHLEAP